MVIFQSSGFLLVQSSGFGLPYQLEADQLKIKSENNCRFPRQQPNVMSHPEVADHLRQGLGVQGLLLGDPRFKHTPLSQAVGNLNQVRYS